MRLKKPRVLVRVADQLRVHMFQSAYIRIYYNIYDADHLYFFATGGGIFFSARYGRDVIDSEATQEIRVKGLRQKTVDVIYRDEDVLMRDVIGELYCRCKIFAL